MGRQVEITKQTDKITNLVSIAHKEEWDWGVEVNPR